MLLSQEQIPLLKQLLSTAEIAVVIDTETNITNRFNDRYCMGIAFCIDGETYYVPTKHGSWLSPDDENCTLPKDLLGGIAVPCAFHNAKFDISVLRRQGIQIPENFQFWDTMLMCHSINEEELSFSLENMGNKYCGSGKLKKIVAVKWEDIPARFMMPYAERDALLTYQLYLTLKPLYEIYEEGWLIDREFLLLLEQMESKGILLDVGRTVELQELCTKQLKKLEDDIGFNPNKISELQSNLFDPPPFGLGLVPRTVTKKTQRPQVNTAFLRSTNHPTCGLLLQHRETKKQLTSYYNSYLNLVGPEYNRIHASFKQHGTVTGRVSCADPNMHQIPRDSPIKKLFLPEDGCEMWEIDFRNIEMRLAAVYSNQQSMLDIFANEGDVHQLTADLLGISRQQAKVVNFLIIYGGEANALSDLLGISFKESDTILKNYREVYPNLYTAQKDAENAAFHNGGWIRMWTGRRRHFRNRYEYRKAFNAIIQGGAFEIVKRATLNIRMYDVRNQVHDSVWVNTNDPRQIPVMEKLMSGWTEEMFGLPFTVDSKRLS